MPAISLTEFIDFVLKVGTAKVTKVVEVKNHPPYNPATDFWKRMRSHLCDFHEGAVDHLSFSGSGASAKKERLYKLAIIGYKKFLGKQDYEWFKPHAGKWSHGNLTVRVNPEIGLIISGMRHLIKLYLKQEKLSKPRINIVLSMMRSTFGSKTYEVAVLDVVRGQLYKGSESSVSLSALLEGEAATFMAIWNSIDEMEQEAA